MWKSYITVLKRGGEWIHVLERIAESTKRKSFTIHDLPVSERPRERLLKLGSEALSAQEILALVLGRGIAGESVMVTAQRLLSELGNLKGIANASIEELSKVKGIGVAKAAQLKASFELGNRVEESYLYEKEEKTVRTPEDAVNLVKRRLRGKKREHFIALLLDTRSHLITTSEISIGSLDTSIAHPREVFKEAISASANSCIFIHNHPSGNPTPSGDENLLEDVVL
ncbi:MAG: DNA repair protein RadC [Methanomicrobia archaeon]|nr:DNA repair protein RadC [Methanomicrobia archaeon]